MKRETKLGIATLAMIVVVLTTIAAVPGIFSSVNSTSGYQVNGSAGSSGQTLCSDGVYFSTPCSVGIGTITGVTVTAPVSGGGSSGVVNIALTGFTPRTCNSNGCYSITNGVVEEWGAASSGSSGDVPVTFPFTFPNQVDNITFGSNNTGPNAGRNNCYISIAATTTGFQASSGGSTNNCYWRAIGN